MFRKDKLPGLVHPYNVFEYFLNKDSGSKKNFAETPVYKWIFQRTTVSQKRRQ